MLHAGTLWRLQWQIHPDPGPGLPYNRLDGRHCASMQGDDPANDGQPESRSTGTRLRRTEALEDPLSICWCNPLALVGHLDPDATADHVGADKDFSLGRGVAHGVVDQVGQHLAQSSGVGHQVQRRRLHQRLNRGIKRVGHFLDQVLQWHMAHSKRGRTRVDLG